MTVAAQEAPEPPELVKHLREVCTARDVPYELLCGAVEESIAAAYREHTGSSSAIARLDPETGGIELYERRTVVAVVADPLVEIALTCVPGEGFAIGDFVDRALDPGSFARVAALSAKRIVFARLLEFERERVWAAYRELEGTLVRGLVQRDIRGALYVLLDDRNEGAMPPWERSPREKHQINEQLVCELQAVRKTAQGPALFLSRASERFVRLLIDDRAVVAGARNAGSLTLLLATRPVDVGHARAQIAGERIEVISFTDDLQMLLERVFMPAKPTIDVRDDLDVVLAISDAPRVHERASIAGRLIGRRVVACKPDQCFDVIAQLEADQETPPAPDETKTTVDIDPELIAKLEEYARENLGRNCE